ncbi:MAG: GntR family transcriptional regulator [Bacteroidota bacterium]
MVEIYTRIRGYAEVSSLSKHEQIVSGMIAAIEDGIVERGDLLPSINMLSGELGYARKTIDKAYGELKDRGLIEARNRKGFFVSTEDVEQVVRVALVLYEFRPFQEVFYNVFRASVGENVQVDTFFHHNDFEVFKDIVTKVAGRYGCYVVAPVIHAQSSKVLTQLTANRLLIIDRQLSASPLSCFVIQEFEATTYGIFSGLRERFQKYDQVVLFFRKHTAYPAGILTGSLRFFKEHGIKYQILDAYQEGSLRKGNLYITVGDADLWSLLEDCIDLSYTLGEDVGVLSHNESRIKKMVHGGISTWSTDFSQMAERAAAFVLERGNMQEVVPTVFIDRGSL